MASWCVIEGMTKMSQITLSSNSETTPERYNKTITMWIRAHMD